MEDVRKISLSGKEECGVLRKNIEDKNFFYLEKSKDIARKELKKRMEEESEV